MKKTLYTFVSALIVVALSSCGTAEQAVTGQPGFSNIQGFRVLSSSPAYLAEFVPLDQVLTINFSQAIDPASVAGSITVREGHSSTPGVSNDITSSVTAALAANASSLTLSFAQPLNQNSTYTIVLNQTLQSAALEPLVFATDVIFYTGAASLGASGALIDPSSDPYVTRADKGFSCSCRSFYLTFNEDLIRVPSVFVTVENLGGFLPDFLDNIASGFANASQPFTDRMNIILVDLGCDPSYNSFDLKFTLEMEGSTVIDLEGNNMQGTYEESFGSPILSSCG